jgi:hypothetical protein
LARDVVKAVALDYGACIRPVQLRKTNLDTGEVEQVLIPCGSTLARVCPPCAERARVLRAAQCREGWHLEDEPSADPRPPGDHQKWLVETLADLQAGLDQADAHGEDTAELDDLIDAVEEKLAATGVRGHPDPSNKNDGVSGPGGRKRSRRRRSTRRRHDAPDLPGRPMRPLTVGRVYPGPNGQLYRPSMFITLTCPSYGPVRDDGTPVDPGNYDYESAARDALHFAALFDRFIQNLRRFAGFDVQYFAAVEPQKRLAPHVHIAVRGTISRADLRKVLAATYHQVWWPADRLIQALRYEPCSPRCANWLRYGITPKNPRPGLLPGACKGKAHRPEHLGYAGRRVLVSRKWSGKTLADHRGDRQAWLLGALGLPAADDNGRYRWALVSPADDDYLPLTRRLMLVVEDRMRWKRSLEEARRRAEDQQDQPPAARSAA